MNSVKIRQAAKVLGAIKNIEVAFLFGSEARGRAGKNSDVDIAVVLKKFPGSFDRLNLKLDISEKLEKIFGRDVDVVILNQAGSILKYQVVKHGKILFERKKYAGKKFKVYAFKEYFDFIPTFNFHYERAKRGK